MEREQLTLGLPLNTSHAAEDFIVGAPNADAHAYMTGWPSWPSHAVALVGPRGCGKSHLAGLWCGLSGAERVPASSADEARLFSVAGPGADPDTDRGAGANDPAARPLFAIEDVDQGVADEAALFHLLNRCKELGGSAVFTARTPPGAWVIDLPDLRSRVRAMPVVQIAEPDDDLLQQVLLKLLGDRQLHASPAAISFLLLHLDRNMALVQDVVAAIDRLSWTRAKPLTRTLARDALAAVSGCGDGA